MHGMTLLKAGMFDILIDGQPGTIADIYPGWHARDRVGIAIDDVLGGIGATRLLQTVRKQKVPAA